MAGRTGLGFTAPQPSSVYWPCSISAWSTGGASQWFLDNMVWPIALVQDMIKWQTHSANLGLGRHKKIHITRAKRKLDWIFIKLCYNDHSSIGLLFLRIEVLQRFSSRKWQLVQLKSHSVMWFAEAVFLRWAGGVGSLSALAGTAYTSLSALFFVGGLDPVELLSFFLREKLLERNFKENSKARWRASSYCLGFQLAL